jgi:hypothetical protein
MYLLLGKTVKIYYEMRNRLPQLSCIIPEKYIYLLGVPSLVGAGY